eukprot:CAMPEP_0197641906 /NCGR_PEP_ID=MMETSP1338-20131121/15717_1 /TAXON_ID=43686 ORGANISM="Pelagodinium beii, Strain RCC1491" /NCGR_SAMPLE_ID=MMETSP1338 /ASSEMBLY_ACC=CAM_ASM_000754 /LENGTH=554 /DNA_ID=CAMNT_0043214951 /DNA_START=165 /DNA_END=1829 /DNA_ORIENTATION=+
MTLQNALRSALGMQDQVFDFADSYGSKINTDMGLRDAMEQGRLPVQANLSDESVHYIENRREELAQMQWKVVRDKMQGCEIHVHQLSQQIRDLKQQMEAQRKDHKDTVEVLREEMIKAMQQESMITQTSIAQISERTAGITHLINAEQNKREFAHQNLEHQLMDLRSGLDEERSARMTEMDGHLTFLKEGKIMMATQKQSMESFEKQHTADMQELQAEMAAQARNSQAVVKEQISAFRCSAEELALKMRQSVSQLNVRLSELAINVTKNSKEVAETNVRMDSLEPQISLTMSSQADLQQRINERQEQLLQSLEAMRIDKQSMERELESTGNNLKELEGAIARTHEDTTKMVNQEMETVRQEMKNTFRKVTTEMSQNTSSLELKIAQRLDKESTSRENHTKQLYEEISRASLAIKEGSTAEENGTVATDMKTQQSPRTSIVRSTVYSPSSTSLRGDTATAYTWSPSAQSNVTVGGAQQVATPTMSIANSMTSSRVFQASTMVASPPQSPRASPSATSFRSIQHANTINFGGQAPTMVPREGTGQNMVPQGMVFRR